jgi:hypothetical protein
LLSLVAAACSQCYYDAGCKAHTAPEPQCPAQGNAIHQPRASRQISDRYLKKLTVRKLRLRGFSPGNRTIEREDVEQVVGEFRPFLNVALEVVELE